MYVSDRQKTEGVKLLQNLIATASFSKTEDKTATIISTFFRSKNIPCQRYKNNVWAFSKYYQKDLPTLLLNSHHDTIKPVPGWQRNPFDPALENGVLYGLGSNDAGGSLISLALTFMHFYQQKDLPFNLIFLASAEEEISGQQGVQAVLPQLGKIDFGIVGEPTQMQMAIAEKGLVVIDGLATGKAGHAAREEGDNAIYTALKDIHFLKNYAFEKISEQLGAVKISVTQINAGTQHNVVPDNCRFVVDVRTTECYTNQEVFAILQAHTKSTLTARSFRLSSSGISVQHPVVRVGQAIGLSAFGSSTLSDQALMPFPTLKIGPGNSARSHTADEFIKLQEIKEGMEIYCQILNGLVPYYTAVLK